MATYCIQSLEEGPQSVEGVSWANNLLFELKLAAVEKWREYIFCHSTIKDRNKSP